MFKNKKGISVVEILIVVVIITVGLVALLNAVTASLKISSLMKESDQAKELAQEALEAVRSFRDGTDWDINGLGTLTLDISYHLEKTSDNPPKWNLVQGEEAIGIFTRKIVFKSVSRDLNSNIVSTGGIVDTNTKKVIATVSRQGKTVEISTYLTNWR